MPLGTSGLPCYAEDEQEQVAAAAAAAAEREAGAGDVLRDPANKRPRRQHRRQGELIARRCWASPPSAAPTQLTWRSPCQAAWGGRRQVPRQPSGTPAGVLAAAEGIGTAGDHRSCSSTATAAALASSSAS